MKIHVCDLMYGSFQSVRYPGPHTKPMLRLLAAAIELVERRGTFILTLDALTLTDASLLPYLQWIASNDEPEDVMLDASSEPFFLLAKTATRDLLQSDTSERDEKFLQTLGYALHNVSEFVAKPAMFRRDFYWGDMFSLAPYLERLSPDLKAAFGRVQGLSVAEFENAVRNKRAP